MRFFTGQYDRSIDAKHRIQLPSHLRAAVDPTRDGAGFYVTLGEHRRTLSIFTERGFEELAARIETEFMPGVESQQFELQFYSLSCHVDLDKQGRILLPERLLTKARFGSDVYLIGQKNRIDIWDRAAFDGSLGVDWGGDDWPNWRGFLRMRPAGDRKDVPG